jgi:hypothetical protein
MLQNSFCRDMSVGHRKLRWTARTILHTRENASSSDYSHRSDILRSGGTTCPHRSPATFAILLNDKLQAFTNQSATTYHQHVEVTTSCQDPQLNMAGRIICHRRLHRHRGGRILFAIGTPDLTAKPGVSHDTNTARYTSRVMVHQLYHRWLIVCGHDTERIGCMHNTSVYQDSTAG